MPAVKERRAEYQKHVLLPALAREPRLLLMRYSERADGEDVEEEGHAVPKRARERRPRRGNDGSGSQLRGILGLIGFIITEDERVSSFGKHGKRYLVGL